jgi:hypothetical protein
VTRGRSTAAGLLLVALAAAGCASFVLPVTLEDATLGAAALRYPDDFASHEAVVRGVAALLARELELPVPAYVTVYLYSSRAVFERGLMNDGRLSPRRAAELSEANAIGVGRRRQLLLLDDGEPPAARAWLGLVAHELTHVVQIELAQGDGRAEQWLAEGMAEWAAFTVLERLGLGTLAERRAAAWGRLRDQPGPGEGGLDLEALGTSGGFTRRQLRDGSGYELAFLMTDYLIRRHGFYRLVEYYRAFADNPDRYDNFHLAFGLTLEEFEREMTRYLGRVPR